jgi:hypothetical protein
MQARVQSEDSTFFTAHGFGRQFGQAFSHREEISAAPILRMVRADAKVGEQQLLSTRVLAAAVRFDRDKDSVDIA